MRVDLFLVDGVVDSGLSLLRDVFYAAGVLGPQLDPHLEPITVTLRATHRRVPTGYGLQVTTEPLTAALDEPPDVIVIPSLGLADADHVLHTVTAHAGLPVLRSLHEQGVTAAAACSGTFFLAEAGLLDGHVATTSWWLGPTMRRRYPRVLLDESQALVVGERVTTAGAALAHLDLGLSLVRRISPALSDAVADYLAVGDRPRQSDVMRPSMLAMSDPVLSAFDRAVRAGLAGPLDLHRIAGDLGVSQRTLQRLTANLLGISPVRYVQQVRLENAVTLLRTTELSVAAVAHAVGYQDASTLGTLIRRRRGVTPEQLRRRRDTSGG